MNDLLLTIMLVSIAGCISEPTETTAQDINGPSSDANAFERVRAVAGPLKGDGSGPGCTATKIAPSFLISAAHCGYAANETVTFYGTSPVGSSLPVLQTAKIVNVIMKPGVDGSLSYSGKLDSDGNWADFVILQIDRADTFGEAATLAWKYPGANVNGTKVGCGHHNDNPNPDGILLQVADTTWSASAGAGSFWTTLVLVDHGDSGGPFYVNNQVLGTASYFVAGSPGTRYTSMPFHLDFILSKIGYRWSGNQAVPVYYGGSMIDSFSSSERVCQYACDARSDCQAYDFALADSQCQLITNISSVSFQNGFHSALHYAGARSSRTGAVVGYVRSDNTDSIVRVATDTHVHEFFYSDAASRWNVGDVTANATIGKNGMAPPAPSSGALLTAYTRADGNNSILYRSGSSLIELTLTGTQWTWFFFPTLSGAPPAGDPAAYVRGDGLSAVLYRATNNHIIEITETIQPSFWTANDLTSQIGAPLAASDPTAYVRSDGISSVVFRATDSQICELFMSPEHRWDFGELSVLAGAPDALGRPSGYVQHDGTNSVLYRNTSSRIEDLWLDGAGWHGADTTGTGAPTISDPVPYLRIDAVEAVLYVGWNMAIGGQLWEIANQGSWQPNNLSALFSTGNVTTNAQPFVAHDGWDTVPFGFASGSQVHVGDLEHQPGSSWWKLDLTLWTGETP